MYIKSDSLLGRNDSDMKFTYTATPKTGETPSTEDQLAATAIETSDNSSPRDNTGGAPVDTPADITSSTGVVSEESKATPSSNSRGRIVPRRIPNDDATKAISANVGRPVTKQKDIAFDSKGKVIPNAVVTDGKAYDAISGMVIRDANVISNGFIDASGTILTETGVDVTYIPTSSTDAISALTSSDGIAEIATGILENKNTLLEIINGIQSEGLDGYMGSLGASIGQLVDNPKIVGNLAESLLQLESLQKLKSIIDTVKSVAGDIVDTIVKFASIDETVFAQTIVRSLIWVGGDPLYDKEFVTFCMKGDYYYTYTLGYRNHSRFRADIINRFTSVIIMTSIYGAKDIAWAASNLYYTNMLELIDWEYKKKLADVPMRMVKSKKSSPSIGWLDDYFHSFKLEPGLYSDDNKQRSDAQLYCNTTSSSISQYDVDYMLPVVSITNPITGKSKMVIKPLYAAMPRILKTLMTPSKYKFHLIHQYNPLLDGQLLQELYELLVGLGLDDLARIVSDRSEVLSGFIKAYDPEPVRHGVIYSGNI